MRKNLASSLAAVILLAEGAGLIGLAIWQIAAVFGGDTESLVSAIALIVLTVIGAAAVIAFGAATWRGESWGRSGGIVTQLLILAVALGAVTGAFAHPMTGLALAVPAIIALVLLVLAARAAAPKRATGQDAASAPSDEGGGDAP